MPSAAVNTEVALDREQEWEAAMVGFDRQGNALKWGLKGRHNNGSHWEGHIEAACSELVASIYTGLNWTGKNWLWTPEDRIPPPDLGQATEVRWCRPRWRGADPPLNFDATADHDDRYYILVVGFAPVMRVLGMIKGAHARRKEWLESYPERDVYRVPPHELVPVPRSGAFE